MPGNSLCLVKLSEIDAVRLDDLLKDLIERGELTHDIIRGTVKTYLDKENCMTKTEIALSFGIGQTVPGSIMEAYYQCGNDLETLIEWLS